MQAELLTIGSELTQGATVNTNAAELARRLSALGISCPRQVTVGDARHQIIGALHEALRRCDLLITTGGLGPTFDDITMEAIAEATRRPLVTVPAVERQVRRFYQRHHRTLTQAALRQALLPQGGQALPNPVGTAPGLWLALRGRWVIALPGVPAEMRAIFDRSVLPRLRRLKGLGAIDSVTLRTAGVLELEIEGLLRTLRVPEQITVGLYPNLRMVDVRLTATDASRAAARRRLARLASSLRRRLGSAVYGTDDETLEGVIGRLLVARRKTVAIAESCTGGLVSDRLTNVPGSSRYLLGSIIAYHNGIKRQMLGVPASTLARHGAVSAQTAKAMAEGVRRATGADLGMSTTGIAGPAGGTTQKPVGLVYLGLADGRRTVTHRCRFIGDRRSIKTQAAQATLDFLRRSLLKKVPDPSYLVRGMAARTEYRGPDDDSALW